MRRGDLVWADLAEPRGSEPSMRRPVLVVQDDLLNASALGTVMVVPLTSNLRRAGAIGNVQLRTKTTSLPKDSVALVCQVMTIDRAWLSEPIAALPKREMREVDAGLRLTLGLGA